MMRSTLLGFSILFVTSISQAAGGPAKVKHMVYGVQISSSGLFQAKLKINDVLLTTIAESGLTGADLPIQENVQSGENILTIEIPKATLEIPKSNKFIEGEIYSSVATETSEGIEESRTTVKKFRESFEAGQKLVLPKTLNFSFIVNAPNVHPAWSKGDVLTESPKLVDDIVKRTAELATLLNDGDLNDFLAQFEPRIIKQAENFPVMGEASFRKMLKEEYQQSVNANGFKAVVTRQNVKCVLEANGRLVSCHDDHGNPILSFESIKRKKPDYDALKFSRINGHFLII